MNDETIGDGVAACRMAAIRRRGLPSGRRARTMRSSSRDPWDAGKKDAGNAVSVNDSIVAETAARIFVDLADPQSVNSSRDGAWKAPLGRPRAAPGLTLVW